MKSTMIRTVSLLMSVFMLLGTAVSLASCGDEPEPSVTTEAPTGTNTETLEESETVEEDHRFDNVNYGERAFRIYNSTNSFSTYAGSNSNHLIEGSTDGEASVAQDAVHARNVAVEELLGVELEYTQIDLPYDTVGAKIRTMLSAGDDEFDLIINKLLPLSSLSLEGYFHNTLSSECVFDFDRPYWYEEYMAELRLMDGYQHFLAGDYFIDVLRSGKLMLLNKGLYEDYFRTDPDELYTWVDNHEWTYEKLHEITAEIYSDVNQNNTVDSGDRFGMVLNQYWGPSIAFAVSADPGFITRDEEGIPLLALHQSNRAADLVERLRELNQSNGVSVGMTGEREILQYFVDNLSLIGADQQLGTLEATILRDMEVDFAILPYPLLYKGDEYVTCTADLTELGVIPVTNRDLAFVSTVLEVLNRETNKTLIPVYYGECLQLQYSRDQNASRMVELIREHIGGSFILGYNAATGSIILQAFSEAMEADRTFEATFKSSAKLAEKRIEKMITSYRKKNHID